MGLQTQTGGGVREGPTGSRAGRSANNGYDSRQKTLPVAPSKYAFTKHDNNDKGVWVSSPASHTAKVVKDLCVIHSTFTEAINHDPAVTFIQTAVRFRGTQPRILAELWLGKHERGFAHYAVMHAKSKHAEQSLFSRLWGTGFMPSTIRVFC